MSSEQGVESSYLYNGLGDRLSQNGVNYTLDLNTDLTQVLSDGTTTYTYGVGRISQTNTTTTEYFLGDALESVRQLTSQSGEVTYAASYSPYGEVTQAGGAGQSAYGFTGEQQSGDLVYLRARYVNVSNGRFLSRDTWSGDVNNPITLGKWTYTNSNPTTYSDPSGYFAIVKYDRQAAVNYAKKYAVNGNPAYRRFASDCTSFVSQALYAGGLIEEMDWFYNELEGRFRIGGEYGHAWAVTDDLFGYLVGNKGFSYSIISGTILPKKAPEGTPQKYEDRYLASAHPHEDNKVIPNPLQIENYGNFNFSSYGIREGDVVLYHQLHAHYVEFPDDDGKRGMFNHAAFVIDASARLTDRFNGTSSHRLAPRIAEHSGGYENKWGASWQNNTHSINDTWTEVQALIVIHIPDTIIYPDACP